MGSTAIIGANQSPRLTTIYLNQAGRVGDPAPGVPVSTAQASGSIVQPYGGQVGTKLTVTNAFIASFADPSVGPLYGGIYMYVQFANSVAAAARGNVLFWSDPLNYIVTPDIPTLNGLGVAGVAVNPTARGNWDWIQIGGIAMTQFGTIAGTSAIGAIVSRLNNAATIVAAPAIDQSFLGYSTLTVPVANQVSAVSLSLVWNY